MVVRDGIASLKRYDFQLILTKLFIDSQVKDLPEVSAIRDRLNIPCEVVDDSRAVFNHVSSASDPVQEGKKVLFLTKNRGVFIKDCPGTRNYICCGYKILHIGTFCSMDCSYCILQSYFHPPVIQYFVNRADLLSELDTFLSGDSISRIGTGEFTDSLIWEGITDLNRLLVEKFSKQSHAVLELKTKTTSVENLKILPHNRKTIMAWSVNAEGVIRSEERRTSSLQARLNAASTYESWGYPVAFHIDPIVIYDGCEEEYKRMIHQVFSQVSPDNVVWISMGTFRFLPDLKRIIQQRFQKSQIIYGEFISGLDGKMRYFKPLRIALYRKIYSWIKEIAPDTLVYLCMEDEEVWEKAFGFLPSIAGGLQKMLDDRVVKLCGLTV